MKAAEKEVEEAKESADVLAGLMGARFKQCARLAIVRKTLTPGHMWVERWEPGRITIRGWKDVLDDFEKIDAASNGGKQRTASEIVAARLKSEPLIVDPDSVRITDMSTIGRNGSIQQFTVELKFK